MIEKRKGLVGDLNKVIEYFNDSIGLDNDEIGNELIRELFMETGSMYLEKEYFIDRVQEEKDDIEINNYRSDPFTRFKDILTRSYYTFYEITKDKCIIYCDDCKSYHEGIMGLYINDRPDCIEFSLKDITCINCNHVYNEGELNYLDFKVKNERIKDVKITKKDNLLNIEFNIEIFSKDRNINNEKREIIIDMDKGISYREDGEVITDRINDLTVNDDEYKEIISLLEEYYEKHNIKYIKFNEYISKKIEVDTTHNENTDRNDIYDLVLYNINPLIDNKSMKMMTAYNKDNKYFNNKETLRSIRVFNVIYKEILEEELNISNKYELLLISSLDYYNENESIVKYLDTRKKYIENINEKIKDINNRIKIYKNTSYHILINFINSNLYKALLEKHDETTLINAIARETEKEWTPISDTCHMYDEIIKMDKNYKLKHKRLRIEKLHDVLSKDLKSLRLTGNEYVYKKKVLDIYNKEINDIQFKIVESGDELLDLSNEMNICVHSYDYHIEKEDSIIVFMKQAGKYVGCLEIERRNNTLVQAKGHHNNKLSESLIDIVIQYCKMNKIRISTSDVNSSSDMFVEESMASFLYQYKRKILEKIIKKGDK